MGIRAVNLRIGLVLGADGGIFTRLALPAKLGLAARIGDGRQWMSWIHVDDLVRIVELAIEDPALTARSTRLRPLPRGRGISSARSRAPCTGRCGCGFRARRCDSRSARWRSC